MSTRNPITLNCSVSTIKIPGRVNPFNASILNTCFGYLLAYRVSNSPLDRYGEEFIECCYLDHEFRQISESWRLLLGSGADEDPRLIHVKDRTVLVYGGPRNDPMNPEERTIYIADLSLDRRQISVKKGSVIRLTHKTKHALCEKNWIPFVYQDKLLLTYTICPHEIVEIKSNGICYPLNTSFTQTLWPGCVIRGGTPAVRVLTNEYLAFFHTHICPSKDLYDNDDLLHLQATGIPIRHYLMGCYTFEVIPAFRLLRYSAGPIVYPGIYNSLNPRIPRHKVVFPGGLIVDQGKVHVSCGENDACTKIVTFELDELLASLVRLS